MWATLAGSAGSNGSSRRAGLNLGTEQKPHPRVHRPPRIMKVAAPRWKHSWIFGQRADSQTVCRFRRRNPDFRWLRDSKCVRLLRAHSGSRGRVGAPSWTRESFTERPLRKPGPGGGSELDQGIVHGFLMMGLK